MDRESSRLSHVWSCFRHDGPTFFTAEPDVPWSPGQNLTIGRTLVKSDQLPTWRVPGWLIATRFFIA